ncbi:Glycoside hydrolase, 38 vacuolar alpha mannosidase [Ceratobasidium sp. 423]|nr:Glycoside hydrolase, 38 vacuolar alpha mannosidase [Ceratobasidium sp. 423]
MGGTHHHHGHTGPRNSSGGTHSYPELNFGVGSKWIKNLTQDRVKKFTDGSYASLNLPALMFTHRIDDAEHVKLEVWSAPGRTKPSFEEAMKQDFKPAKKGQQFGPSFTVKIPAEWEKYERVQFEFDPGCEAMIFTTSGVPLQGITGGFDGDRRVEFILDKTKREYSFVIESSCNGMFGISGIAPPDQNRYFTLASADLVVPNQDAWHLFWDFTTLREIIDDLPGNSPLQNLALRTANEIMNEFQVDDPLYPSLFEEVKSKIKQGLFEPIGGAWVEHDGNMPSGEAFIRQMTFGQRFFQSRFGVRCRTGWLPDSFGLSGSIPQLMRSAGMQRFFTQKLSWNNVNVFPHSTFNWIGIDGTQILCHMTPVDTYTAQATTGDVRKAVNNHKNLESSDMGLLVFGNGDGGGGPLAKMLENLRRVRAAGNNSRELPLVNMGHTTEEFFDRLEKESGYGSALPNWHGELYLEFHRGTYTSHGSIKKGNRKSEVLLRDVELVATIASLTAGYAYPKQRIDDSWEKLLLNQFHDGNVAPIRAEIPWLTYVYVIYLVLPGSAIGMVYEDAEKLYGEITKECKSILEEAFDTLLVGSTPIDPHTPFEISALGKVLAVNTTPFPRREVVQIPLGNSGGKSLRTSMVQISADGRTGYVLMDARDGAGIAQPTGLFADVKPVSGKFRRELIAPGKTGGLVIFSDQPNYWDAWDVEIHHLEKFTELEFADIRILENGPARASLEAQVKYGQTTIWTTISLDAVPSSLSPHSRSFVRFDAKVDWHQRHEILKFTGNILRISLLRAATSPDAEQDQGEHAFSWAVLPHLGHFLESDVPQVAYTFNSPLHLRYVPDQGPDGNGAVSSLVHKALFSVAGAPNVILETVKRGDDDDFSTNPKGERTVVLRLYEAFGGHARASLNVSKKLKVSKAAITNVLEDHTEELKEGNSDDQVVSFPLKFRGFEVVTVKLTVALNKAQHKSYVTYSTFYTDPLLSQTMGHF